MTRPRPGDPAWLRWPRLAGRGVTLALLAGAAVRGDLLWIGIWLVVLGVDLGLTAWTHHTNRRSRERMDEHHRIMRERMEAMAPEELAAFERFLGELETRLRWDRRRWWQR